MEPIGEQEKGLAGVVGLFDHSIFKMLPENEQKKEEKGRSAFLAGLRDLKNKASPSTSGNTSAQPAVKPLINKGPVSPILEEEEEEVVYTETRVHNPNGALDFTMQKRIGHTEVPVLERGLLEALPTMADKSMKDASPIKPIDPKVNSGASTPAVQITQPALGQQGPKQQSDFKMPPSQPVKSEAVSSLGFAGQGYTPSSIQNSVNPQSAAPPVQTPSNTLPFPAAQKLASSLSETPVAQNAATSGQGGFSLGIGGQTPAQQKQPQSNPISAFNQPPQQSNFTSPPQGVGSPNIIQNKLSGSSASPMFQNNALSKFEDNRFDDMNDELFGGGKSSTNPFASSNQFGDRFNNSALYGTLKQTQAQQPQAKDLYDKKDEQFADF